MVVYDLQPYITLQQGGPNAYFKIIDKHCTEVLVVCFSDSNEMTTSPILRKRLHANQVLEVRTLHSTYLVPPYLSIFDPQRLMARL